MNKKNNIIQLNNGNLKEVRKIVIKDLITNTKFGYYEKEKKKYYFKLLKKTPPAFAAAPLLSDTR